MWKKFTTLALALALIVTVFAAPAQADTPTVIYMSASGSDSNDGSDLAHGVKTLERVEALVSGLTTDVEVRIDQGTYTAGQTYWTTFITGHSITFMPADFTPGMALGDFAGRPIFQSNGGPGWWMYAQLPSGHPGGDTNLRFYYLQIQGYATGGLAIHGRYTTVNGLRVPATAGANSNYGYGLYFQNLGNVYNTSEMGIAGLDLINSDNNYFRNIHFVHLENTTADASHIHGVYLAHGSDNNTLLNSDYSWITGNPVDIRNGSNDNTIDGNTFTRSGKYGYLSDWFLEAGTPHECASWDNTLSNNDMVSAYNGSTTLPLTDLTPAGATYAGLSPCVAGGTTRVITSGNY